MDILNSLVILFAIILMNSFFVMAEIAIIASRKSKLERMHKSGNDGASKALKLVSKPETFLSTVQIGVTFMSIMLGVYGGSYIAKDVEKLLLQVPYISNYSTQISYALTLLFVTYFTVLGEITPKRIALIYPEKISSYISYIMTFFTKFCYPLVQALAISTNGILKIFNVKIPEDKMCMDELRSIINRAEFEGMLPPTEQGILKRIMHMNNTQVGAIMTPRNKMIYLNLKDKKSANISKIKKHHFNYFPVIDGDLNNLIGIVPIKNLLSQEVTNEKIKSVALNFPIIYIPEMARVSKLMDIFKEKKLRMAIALDEYGDIEGLVTLNDILKILIGELAVGPKNRLPEIVKNSDGSYIISGNSLIEEVMTLLNLTSLPGEEDEDYRTLASFVLKQIDHFPEVGDSFTSLGWSFKVINMDKRRVERVLVAKITNNEKT